MAHLQNLTLDAIEQSYRQSHDSQMVKALEHNSDIQLIKTALWAYALNRVKQAFEPEVAFDGRSYYYAVPKELTHDNLVECARDVGNEHMSELVEDLVGTDSLGGIEDSLDPLCAKLTALRGRSPAAQEWFEAYLFDELLDEPPEVHHDIDKLIEVFKEVVEKAPDPRGTPHGDGVTHPKEVYIDGDCDTSAIEEWQPHITRSKKLALKVVLLDKRLNRERKPVRANGVER